MTLRAIEWGPSTSTDARCVHERRAVGVEAAGVEKTGRRARARASEPRTDAPGAAHPRGPVVSILRFVLMCVNDRLLCRACTRERTRLPLDRRGLARPRSQRKDLRSPF